MDPIRRSFVAALLMSSLGLPGVVLAAEPTLDEVAKPSLIGDMVLGAADAKVTIVEYASMTCPHCAVFEKEVYPKLKTTYIDTGKVKIVFREFPLDIKAAAASLLARCAAKGDAGKFFEVNDTLFRTQDEWVPSNTEAALRKLGLQVGIDEAAFSACISDKAMLQGMGDTQKYASETLKVDSTPTFFVNGARIKGGVSFEKLQETIEPLLKAADGAPKTSVIEVQKP